MTGVRTKCCHSILNFYIVIPTLSHQHVTLSYQHCRGSLQWQISSANITAWAKTKGISGLERWVGDSWVDHVGLWTGFGNFSKYKSTLDTATLNPKWMPDNDDLTCWKNDDCCSVFLGGQSWRFRFVPFWSFKFKKGAGKNWRELPPPYSCELVQQKLYICTIVQSQSGKLPSVHCTKWHSALLCNHNLPQASTLHNCAITKWQVAKLCNHKIAHCQFVIA